MTYVRPSFKLTLAGAMHMLQAAVEKATAMGQPQCIAIVDEGCNLVAFVRMDGSRVLSVDSATRKAMTAATNGQPTGGVPFERAMQLAEATGGRVTHLLGGLPILVDGHIVGGIGVGSGSGEQDLEVAKAAVAAFDAVKAPPAA
jgi:glc operon protein GlcG